MKKILATLLIPFVVACGDYQIGDGYQLIEKRDNSEEVQPIPPVRPQMDQTSKLSPESSGSISISIEELIQNRYELLSDLESLMITYGDVNLGGLLLISREDEDLYSISVMAVGDGLPVMEDSYWNRQQLISLFGELHQNMIDRFKFIDNGFVTTSKVMLTIN